jgi:hypothetical protein
MKTTFVADDPSAVSELALLRSMIIGSDVSVSIDTQTSLPMMCVMYVQHQTQIFAQM